MPICFVVHLFITIVNDGYLSLICNTTMVMRTIFFSFYDLGFTSLFLLQASSTKAEGCFFGHVIFRSIFNGSQNHNQKRLFEIVTFAHC